MVPHALGRDLGQLLLLESCSALEKEEKQEEGTKRRKKAFPTFPDTVVVASPHTGQESSQSTAPTLCLSGMGVLSPQELSAAEREAQCDTFPSLALPPLVSQLAGDLLLFSEFLS